MKQRFETIWSPASLPRNEPQTIHKHHKQTKQKRSFGRHGHGKRAQNTYYRSWMRSPWLASGSYSIRTELRSPGSFLNTSQANFHPFSVQKYNKNKKIWKSVNPAILRLTAALQGQRPKSASRGRAQWRQEQAAEERSGATALFRGLRSLAFGRAGLRAVDLRAAAV